LGDALHKLSADPEVLDAMFEILEMQRLLDSHAQITLVPQKSELMTQLLASTTPLEAPSASASLL
jgi:hypothetical protein